jgi:hypothetical protein
MWKIIFKRLNKQKGSKRKEYFGGKKQQFGEFSISKEINVFLKYRIDDKFEKKISAKFLHFHLLFLVNFF